MDKLLRILAFITGLFLFISGFGKLFDIYNFQILIIQYGFQFFNFFAPFIVVAEIFMGTCLILNMKTRLISIFTFIMLIIFTVIYTYGYLKNGITNCGCFGRLTMSTSPIFTYVRNIILIIISFILVLHKETTITIDNWKRKILITILFPTVFAAGWGFRFIPLRPSEHAFYNKNINDTELKSYIKSDHKKKLLMFISYNCSHCWNSIENYKAYLRDNVVDTTLAYVITDLNTTRDDSIKEVFFQNFKGIQVHEIDMNSIDFIDALPTSFYIENDTIKEIIEGELISHYIMYNRKTK